MFELNFKDERYLPFEGAGAISSWRLELPTEIRQFDYATIADVILQVRYTSVNGGEQLKTAATEHVKTLVAQTKDMARDEGLFMVFDLPHDYSTQWPKFAADRDEDRELNIAENIRNRLPFYLANGRNASVKLNDVFLVSSKDPIDQFNVKLNDASGSDIPFGQGPNKITIKAFADLGIEISADSNSQDPVIFKNETPVTGDGTKQLKGAWALLRLTFEPKS